MSTVAAPPATKIPQYINGQWVESQATEWQDIINPATAEVLGRVPMAGAAEVTRAIEAAAAAYPEWRRTPAEDRIQPLFKLKMLLEENLDDIARIITQENGKTLGEAKGEMRRSIENVEVACGIPTMMQGCNLEDVARGIDEIMIRQPLGVVAAITASNFPGMIPFWFLPYAIACGNTLIIKPSERVPLTMKFAFELLERTGIPKGVVNLVNGGKAAVDTLLDHPAVRAVSFVDRLRSRNTSMRAPVRTASAPSARAAPRITSSFCPTPTCRWRRRSSPTAPSAAPASAASPSPLRSPSVKRRKPSAIRSAKLPPISGSVTVSTRACRWGR